ncbi:MAG: hypothetical protein SGPRY_011653 [Prymnesium sp.]
MAGGVGVSTHADSMLRLWEAESGRKLGCSRRLKRALTCCHTAGEGLISLGDEGGAVHLFHADIGLERPVAPAVDVAGDAATRGRIESVLVMPSAASADSALVVASVSHGGIFAFDAFSSQTAWVVQRDGGVELEGRVGLATGAEGGLFGVDLAGARRIDAERGVVTWSSPSSPSTDLAEFSFLSLEERVTPCASFSVGWGLLAGAIGEGGVDLWDSRLEGSVGRVSLPGPHRLAGCVHLDQAWSGFEASHDVVAPPGHLLVSSADGGGIHIFDIRRFRSALRGDVTETTAPHASLRMNIS